MCSEPYNLDWSVLPVSARELQARLRWWRCWLLEVERS